MLSTKSHLAMVHGWGMNGRVFDALAERLSDHFEAKIIDLPGHGGRASLPLNSLDAWANDLAQQLPDGSLLLGWSLGGQVAMRAALLHPAKVSRLILVATTPRFVTSQDWAHGMVHADLDAFGTALIADPRATLLRFLSLQTRGMPGQKALLQQLRETLLAAPDPEADALSAGLDILQTADLRADVRQLAQPSLVIHGALDTLTPPAAGEWLATVLPAARHLEIDRAAHAPHLSHADDVAAEIRSFVHG